MKITSSVYQLLLTLYNICPFKKTLCVLLKSAKIPNKKFYMDLHFNGCFEVSIEKDIKFKMHHFLHATIENEVFWKGIRNGWEKVSINLWIQLSKNANVIFDIGANTGIYSLCSAAINSNTEIFAFEPSKKVFAKLLHNIELNHFNNISCHQVAISNKSGLSDFFDFDSAHQYSASLNEKMLFSEDQSKMDKYTVITNTFNDFIVNNNIEKIDLIKIDTEMHEKEVFEGMGTAINKFKPDFLVEILTEDIGSYVESFFDKTIYDFFMIDEINKPIKTNVIDKSGMYNYLICKKASSKYLNLY